MGKQPGNPLHPTTQNVKQERRTRKIKTMSTAQAAKRRSIRHRRDSAAKSRFMTAFLLSPHLRSLPVVAGLPPSHVETFEPVPDRHRAAAGRPTSSGPRPCTFSPEETLCRPSSPRLLAQYESFGSSRLFLQGPRGRRRSRL